jgi:hypothetical protein
VLSRAGYYACMRSGSFADRLSSGGVFRLASYYACMRSSRPEAETRADGCCHARAITHACAAGASRTGSRAGVCSVSRAITHACAAVAPRPRRERTGAVTRGLLRMHAQRELPAGLSSEGCVPSRELLRMHAQQSPRGRCASGRVRLASYYACMRSGSFRAGLSSEGCVPSRELLRMHAQQSPKIGAQAGGSAHSRAITHACAVRLSTTGSRARPEGAGGGATHACVIARRRGHHPGRAGGDRLACVSRASSAPAPRRHPPTRRDPPTSRGQAGQGSGSGAWCAISVRISESCCTAQATAELKLSPVCSQGRRPPSSRQCA